MPELILMRHGKAVQTDRIADRERRLTPRGKREAAAIGRLIARERYPDCILCSPSLRTRQTLALALPDAAERSRIMFLDALYEPAGDYIDVIAQSGDSAERLLVIGHNPAVQETALALVGGGDSGARSQMHEKFPTAAAAVIACDGGWRALAPLSGRLVTFLIPPEAER